MIKKYNCNIKYITKMSTLTFMSFGHCNGTPSNVTKVFNISNMSSPNRNICKKYDGTSAKLQADLMLQKGVSERYLDIFCEICHIIKNNEENDNNDIVIAIGCQEGIHRSVAFVEMMSRDLKGITIHRELFRKKNNILKQQNISKSRDKKYELQEEE